MNIFKRVEQWNIDRDNTQFSLFTEVKMLAEELYELIGYDRVEAKERSLELVNKHLTKLIMVDANPGAIADAAGDLIYIAIGTLYKLGYDAEEVLATICDANDKKGKTKDAFGKIIKSEDFVEPIHESNIRNNN